MGLLCFFLFFFSFLQLFFFFFFFILINGIITGEIFNDSVPFESKNPVDHFIGEKTVVGYDQQTTFEAFQILFQYIQRDDIQIIGWLVQDQEIRIAHQYGKQIQSSSFPSAQLFDQGILLFVGEHEIFQELRSGHNSPVAQIDAFGNVFYDIDHPVRFIESDTGLFVVAVNHGFADRNRSAVRLQILGNNIQERRFAHSVFPDNTDFFSPDEFIREIAEYTMPVEAFRYMVEFQDFFTQSFTLDVQFQFFLCRILRGCFFEFVKVVYPVLCFMTTGLRHPAHPFLFGT